MENVPGKYEKAKLSNDSITASPLQLATIHCRLTSGKMFNLLLYGVRSYFVQILWQPIPMGSKTSHVIELKDRLHILLFCRRILDRFRELFVGVDFLLICSFVHVLSLECPSYTYPHTGSYMSAANVCWFLSWSSPSSISVSHMRYQVSTCDSFVLLC